MAMDFERLVSGGWIAMWELLVWSWCLGEP